jgi:hypothetical protein
MDNDNSNWHGNDAHINYESKSSDAGTRTRVAWVKARYPNQLDYVGTRLVHNCIELVR